MNHSIIERRYYILSVELRSPISVSNGESSYTDSDVIRNGSGVVFVPGTSLAGAFRNYINEAQNATEIFGFAENHNGKMSTVHISDLYFDSKPIVSARDGIRIVGGNQKGNDNKYDLEIIETGAVGKIYIQFIKRHETYDCDNILYQIVKGINDGEIRIGAHKNRGFGRLFVNKVYEKKFSKDILNGDSLVNSWLAFVTNRKDVKEYTEVNVLENNDVLDAHYIKFSVPLKQKGGISVRRYSTKPGEADYEHITCNGESVIPGFTWKGAIRAHIKNLLEELGFSTRLDEDSYVDGLLQEWFGYDVKRNMPSRQSHVVIAESIIRDAKRVTISRNNVDRFTSSTVKNMLYTEVASFSGSTELEIWVSKKYEYYKAIVGMLFLVAQDLENGYLVVGGQGAIGRGIFESNGDIRVSEQLSKSECEKALYQFLYEVK